MTLGAEHKAHKTMGFLLGNRTAMGRVSAGAFRAALIVLAVVTAWATASAQEPLAGVRDFSFGTTGVASPTGEKPESKLWFNDGVWWGSLYNGSAQAYHIYRFNTSSQSWTDTGTQIDDRNGSNGDVLWDGGSGKLYVASHTYTSSGAASTSTSVWGRLYRYTYNSSSQSYSLDSGFPVNNVTQGKSETMTLAKDTTGRLWVTYTQGSHVFVNNSTTSDSVWGTPFQLPVTNAATNNLTSDDISSIIAFGPGKIGVLWSNQSTKKDYFIVHDDADPPGTWSTEEVALPLANGVGNADDHINLKTDNSGRVFAAVKTSLSGSSSPLVMLLVRSAGGTWSNFTYGKVSDHHTRAIVLLDLSDNLLYMFAGSPDSGTPQSIYYKVTSLSNISFTPGLGAPFLQGSTDLNINNPTSTKQNVSSSTGMIVMGSDRNTHFYVHNMLSLGAGSQPTITSFSPTSGPVGTQVTINGTNLDAASTLAFNGRVAEVTPISSTQVTAIVPSGAASGPLTASTTQGPVGTSTTNFTVTKATAPPTFSPVAGTYTSPQTVTISDATSGAVIYYTTNGTTPTTSSTKYTGPITVSTTTTIKAMATSSGLANSAVSSATYTINGTPSTVATPTFTPTAGTYTSAQSVTISDTTSGASIFYTTDGSTPTSSSTPYTGPITVGSTTTIKAIATAAGMQDSAVASATYTINSTPSTVATPTFTPAAGTYTSAQSVTISDTTSGASIFYTTDGSTPTSSSTPYTGPINVASTTTLKAIATAAGMQDSAVASATYTINSPPSTVATPTFTPAAGTYTSAQSVTISDTTSGASIFYTTDGSTPTSSSTPYTGPITVGSTTTIKAIATAAGMQDSAVASATYTINSAPSVVATPTFSPAAGTYTSTQSVTISDATSGASIFYTTDGSTPTSASTPYTGPISVASTTTIKAIATAPGMQDSTVASATYTINTPPSVVATPTFTPAAGTYTTTQSVTISDSTSGATIFYTTDGSTPTTNSTQYTGPISVASTTTIKAFATATGMQDSSVASATYTINSTVATPTFSPAPGTYSTTQSVTISDATSGATIFYTTDGSTPTTNSTQYTGPVSVAATTTIKAFATATGKQDSSVATATYTISTGTPNSIDYSGGFTATGLQLNGSAAISSNRLRITPATLSVAGSAFASTAVNVQAFTTDFDFQITQPNGDGFTFAIQGIGPTAIGGNGQALGYGSSNTPAITKSMAIKFDLFSNAGEGPDSTGLFTNGARPTVPAIDLSSTGLDLHSGHVFNVHMTYDGAVLRMVISDKTNTAILPYTLAFNVNIPSLVGSTSGFVGFTGATGSKSAIQDILNWTFNSGSVTSTTATPTFTPAAGSYTGPQSVTIADATAGSTIYYTTDGSTPTVNSTQYTGPITVSATTTIKAMATATGKQSSGVASATYTLP